MTTFNEEEYKKDLAKTKEDILYTLAEVERGKGYYNSIDEYLIDFPEIDWHPDYINGLRRKPHFLIKAHPTHGYSTIPGHYRYVGMVIWSEKDLKVYINDGDDGYMERYFGDLKEAEFLMDQLRGCWLWSDKSLKDCFNLING